MPVMGYKLPEYLQTRKLLNMREDISFSLTYNGNPDTIFYGAVLIYDSKPVTTFTFNYLDFKFRMVD